MNKKKMTFCLFKITILFLSCLFPLGILTHNCKPVDQFSQSDQEKINMYMELKTKYDSDQSDGSVLAANDDGKVIHLGSIGHKDRILKYQSYDSEVQELNEPDFALKFSQMEQAEQGRGRWALKVYGAYCVNNGGFIFFIEQERYRGSLRDAVLQDEIFQWDTMTLSKRFIIYDHIIGGHKSISDANFKYCQVTPDYLAYNEWSAQFDGSYGNHDYEEDYNIFFSDFGYTVPNNQHCQQLESEYHDHQDYLNENWTFEAERKKVESYPLALVIGFTETNLLTQQMKLLFKATKPHGLDKIVEKIVGFSDKVVEVAGTDNPLRDLELPDVFQVILNVLSEWNTKTNYGYTHEKLEKDLALLVKGMIVSMKMIALGLGASSEEAKLFENAYSGFAAELGIMVRKNTAATLNVKRFNDEYVEHDIGVYMHDFHEIEVKMKRRIKEEKGKIRMRRLLLV